MLCNLALFSEEQLTVSFAIEGGFIKQDDGLIGVLFTAKEERIAAEVHGQVAAFQEPSSATQLMVPGMADSIAWGQWFHPAGNTIGKLKEGRRY